VDLLRRQVEEVSQPGNALPAAAAGPERSASSLLCAMGRLAAEQVSLTLETSWIRGRSSEPAPIS
jgi:hypothetical protein